MEVKVFLVGFGKVMDDFFGVIFFMFWFFCNVLFEYVGSFLL